MAARRVAAALRAGRVDDDVFDRFLPPDLRDVSSIYWTPLHVVRHAAAWLRELPVRTVVDIGSGAGKFCVAAALLTRVQVVGLEKRAALVGAAGDLADLFGVADRVSFVVGDLVDTVPPMAEAYYFFNPFGEYTFASPRFADPVVASPHAAFVREVDAATATLQGAPRGTFVITFNGFGGRMPPGYEQLDVAAQLPGTLRLWRKQVE